MRRLLLILCAVLLFVPAEAARRRPAKAAIVKARAKGKKAAQPSRAKGKSAKRRAKMPVPPPVSAGARQSARSFVEQATAPVQPVKLASTGANPAALAAIENGAALVPFFERLFRAATGPEAKPVHVLHYGDSHTASDDWAAALRDAIQSRFGAGGPGFSLIGRPYNSYRRYDVKGSSSSGWYTDGLYSRIGDGRYGLGGVSLTVQRTGEWTANTFEGTVAELYYLQQPAGGAVQITDNGEPVTTLNTDGELGPGYFSLPLTPGPHRLELRTVNSGPVRLFGWAADHPRGVTWETLGINGANASITENWDDEVLADNLARRDPGLILLAYGTNDAGQPGLDATAYEARFSAILQRFRRLAPAATILVIGPPDRMLRQRRAVSVYPRVDIVTEAQRRAARANGCAFWDWRRRMGGPGAMRQWVAAGMAQGDYVHLTGAGYRLVGETLWQDLMAHYAVFDAARRQLWGAGNGQAGTDSRNRTEGGQQVQPPRH